MLDINRVATAIIVIVVVIIGGVVTLTDPSSLDFESYIKDVSIAVGLLGVGYGLDARSRP